MSTVPAEQVSPIYIDNRRKPSQALSTDARVADFVERRRKALQARKQYEPDWQLAKQFLANKQWVMFSKRLNRVIAERNPQRRERITVNVITQYVWTTAGKLISDNFLPELFFRQEDIGSEDYAAQANRAMEYAWYDEIEAEERIFDACLKMITYGLAGIQTRYDKGAGPSLGQQPMRDGQPMMDPAEARQYMAEQRAAGQNVQMGELYEGCLRWDVLTPFHILPPPGIEHERDFPWLMVERIAPIEQLKRLYGQNADKLQEQNIQPVDSVGDVADEWSSPPNLSGMALVTTGFEFPTQRYPKGRTVIFSQGQLLEQKPQLPYLIAGKPACGVRFFKFHRIPNRFWPVGLVEPLIGSQRERNRSRSQYIEMKDRGGLGRIYARPGSYDFKNQPEGKAFEVVEIRQGFDFPQETPGVGPGDWIGKDVEMHDADMDMVAGMREVSLGQAPGGVSAYSAMALLAEQDDRRVGPILKNMRSEITWLVRYSLADIKNYWPARKNIEIAGQDGAFEAFVFNTAQLPECIYVKVGEGAPVPRNNAAEIQKIFDIFDRGISSGQPQPLDWLYRSLEAGKALALPEPPNEVQKRLAEHENMLMARGVPVQVHPTDDPNVHLPEHENALAAAQLIPELEQYVLLLDEHIQEHMANQQPPPGASAPFLQGPLGALGGQGPGAPMPAGVTGQPGNTAPAGNVGSVGVPPAFVNRLSPMPPNVR